MQTSTQSQTTAPGENTLQAPADKAYQVLTLAAMVLLLVSLWVF